MTRNIIHASNIGGTWDGAWDPATFWGHHVVLAPMFAIHEGARIHRLRDIALGLRTGAQRRGRIVATSPGCPRRR